MDFFWITIGVVGAAFTLGHILGRWGEARLWRLKGESPVRTAQCSAGRFYYIVPEREYVEKHL